MLYRIPICLELELSFPMAQVSTIPGISDRMMMPKIIRVRFC